MSVNSKMTAIADAIRAKTGGTGLLTLDDMAQDIAAIDTSENLDDVLDDQESLIDQIQAALEDKGVKPEQTKTATPSLSQQTIVPDSGKTLSGVTVEPITSTLLTSLDPDFKPENIAKDANLFGLVGTHAGGSPAAYGNITPSSGSATLSITGLPFAPKLVTVVYIDTLRSASQAVAAYAEKDTTARCAYAGSSGWQVNYADCSADFTSNGVAITMPSGISWTINRKHAWIVLG